ncbi:MAG: ribosome silencing factor [Deltaproteobacteria bacterium]|nr:ribosome silencing factor [Deltaproteobacteria bacterium]
MDKRKADADTKKRVVLCVNAALEKKATNLIILKVKEVSSVTDYFIICSGSSDRQVQAVAASIQETLKKAGIAPLGVEGENIGKWVLMDYGDFIVHIFYDPTRQFYEIERLWSEVPQMAIADDTIKIKALKRGM